MTTTVRPTLTPAQRRVVFAILDLHATHGRPPTVRELMPRLGVRSPNGVVSHLNALRRKGCVLWEPTHARTLLLVASAIAEPVPEWPAVEDAAP
jgi:SOS-response transcriptional repressor LexA